MVAKRPKGCCSHLGEKAPTPVFGEDFYGGIEVHYPKKPYDFEPDEPPIKDCWLTGCDCWPDGSSLFFSEELLPYVEDHHKGNDCTDIMNNFLLDWYEKEFEGFQ